MGTVHQIVAAAACVSLLGAAGAFAGPITPPPGPVSPTPGPEPRIAINAVNTPGDNDSSPSVYKITQPGSYYLTGNLSGVSGKHGIEITSSGVTIDLNGFELAGVASSLDGVTCTANFRTSIEVRNGTIRNWGGDGVDFLSLTVAGGSATRVRATQNGGMGIGIGNRSTAVECEATTNVSSGIVTGHNCVVSASTASNNGSIGILTSDGCAVNGCVGNENASMGISTGDGCAVETCAARANANSGISVGEGSTISGCTASENDSDGFLAANGSTVSACSAHLNDGRGISAGYGASVRECTVLFNSNDGIFVTGRNIVIANNCADNGNAGEGAGIHAVGTNSRIEGNKCSGNDTGILVFIAGNIIIRNTCSDNTTNWHVAPGNVCLVVNATTAPGINGNSGGAAPGSTDPNANFTF